MTRKDWISKNPLRVWRNAQAEAMTISEVSVLLNLSSQTVSLWERGCMQPSPKATANLVVIAGDDIGSKWKKWWAKRPK